MIGDTKSGRAALVGFCRNLLNPKWNLVIV